MGEECRPSSQRLLLLTVFIHVCTGGFLLGGACLAVEGACHLLEGRGLPPAAGPGCAVDVLSLLLLKPLVQGFASHTESQLGLTGTTGPLFHFQFEPQTQDCLTNC